MTDWPGIRPLSIPQLKSISQSTKSTKQISIHEKPVKPDNKSIKHFGRVTLMGDTLSLFPSNYRPSRYRSTDKIIMPKRSEEFRMDRYEFKRQPRRSVE
jgi:hypothetical protein